MAEGELILKLLGPIKSICYDSIRNYVGYIGSCDEHLGALYDCLEMVCDKKDDIKKKEKLGKDEQREITSEAQSWLHKVKMLVNEENMNELMYMDIDTAKYVVKILGKKSLKRRISKESEMQELVVKVMNKLKEEMEDPKVEDKTRKTREADYKHVAEVVVDVMRNTVDELKKLMKEDKKMVTMALRTLKGTDLDKLTKDDQEMEEIVREAVNASDEEEQWQDHDDDEEFTAPQPLLAKIPAVGERNGNKNNNKAKEAIKKLFSPLGKLMDDGDFKKVMPEAGGVKLVLDVIDGLFLSTYELKKETHDTTKQHRGCCCGSFSLCARYHGRYQMSKKAESIVNHIQNHLTGIGKFPQDPVTLPIRRVDMKQIPTQFFKGLVSRTKMVDQIVEKLNDHKVYAVGVFGMGGAGKTTLAKEVSFKAKDAFAIKVIVEISDAPDFVRIQGTIAESIGLPLHDIHSVSERAIRLYNRLSDVKKEKKILIILDNVWKKLNLDEIGIPRTCKLLLTTRDKEVCRVMDIQDNNMHKVGVMNTNEARELFKSLTGNQVDAREYKNVVERLLNKCGGLPLAIVATANSLKDKDLSSWVKFADDLEKPISSQRSGNDYHHTFTILKTSYKFIQPDEKRIFFLLACLSPLGSSVSIESLIRYGMGLNLFEHVNKLSEAIEEAVTWANELMLASMLLEGDVKGDVKVHDIVRDFAISYATKVEKHKFMVEAVPRWMDDETLKKYTAMSLMSKNDYCRLSGVQVCKLQILILKGDRSSDFDAALFNGMVNLKVLTLSNMDFKPTLPESMRKLKKLRTLCIEGCRLGNIELVGELVNLLVLSFRGSSMENIPSEIGNLHKLLLLDLGGCTSSKLPLIPNRVLSKLSRLEGLYMFNKKQPVLERESGYEEASALENIELPYLNALEINVKGTQGLPFDDETMNKLDKFRISLFSSHLIEYTADQSFCRALNLAGIKNVSEFLKISRLKVLFKKADYLRMMESVNFENVLPLLDQEGFRSLTSLHLDNCDDIKCIVDGRTMNTIVFPHLQSLKLEFLGSLEKICNGDVSPGSFSSLQTIELSQLEELRSGLPLGPCNVKEIKLSGCRKLEFIYIEDEQVLATDLLFLKTLELDYLPNLLSLVGPKEVSNSSDALREPRPFFGEKIGLPSLELFKLEWCRNVGKLWSNEIQSGFQNLKDIRISFCQKLSNVGSPSVFSNLIHLENLSITGCKEMNEVISHEDIQESEICEHAIVFPQLKSLTLVKLDNLGSFYGGRSKLEFPKLKTLILEFLKSMTMFAKLENSSALFNEKIDFPCLEELEVIKVNEVTGLWDKKSLTTKSNPAPMLRQLELGSSTGLLRQIPSVVLENLTSLILSSFDFQDGDAVFSSSNLGEKGGFVWIYSQLPHLKELKVEDSESLKELFEKKDYNPVSDALKTFCRQVKTLDLKRLPSLNPIPLHLFKSIVSLTLCALKWNYVFSTDVFNSLHQLEFLSIEDCDKMEALVINDGSQIKLSSLKELQLTRLESFIGISTLPKNEAALHLPLLESLTITGCHMDHFWQGSIFAPSLQRLSILACDNLQYFILGNQEDTIELLSLRFVQFEYSKNIKSISNGSLTAPKLREVTLNECDKMECFYPGNQNHDGDLHLPSLEVVDISYCRNLHAFSLRRLVAPKLTQIKYDYKENLMLPYDDLNHFLKENKPISNSTDEEELGSGTQINSN